VLAFVYLLAGVGAGVVFGLNQAILLDKTDLEVCLTGWSGLA
jgi:hypothetical protein